MNYFLSTLTNATSFKIFDGFFCEAGEFISQGGTSD